METLAHSVKLLYLKSIPSLVEELADACAQILLDSPSEALVTDDAMWMESIEQSVAVIESSDTSELAERMAVALEHARVREHLAHVLQVEAKARDEATLAAAGDACVAYLAVDDDWHEAVVVEACGPEVSTIKVLISQFGAVQMLARTDVVLLKDVADEDEETTAEGVCEMCERRLPITHHHLRPRSEHSRLAKHFPRSVLELTVPICRGCHNAVHHSESNFTLAQKYFTLDLLMAHPEIARWVVYARGTKRQTSWDMAMMRNQAAKR